MAFVYFTKFWPRRDYNSLLERTVSISQSLLNTNHSVTICSTDLNHQHKKELQDYPFQFVDINPNKIANSLAKAKLNPQFFMFDSVQTEEIYSGILYNKWNKCPRILDLCRLPKLQAWRKQNYRLLPEQLNPLNNLLAPENVQQIFTQNQLRAIARSDFVFSGNQFIYYLLKNSLKNKYCAHICSGYPLEQYSLEIANLEYRPFRNRDHFIFMGNLDKPSSKESLHCLITFIWPLIRKQLPDVKLFIYGTGKDETLIKNKSKLEASGIIFKGKMEDTEDLSKFRALLYPNIYSVGLRTRILESWFNHLPVVTTPIGAEGLFLQALNPSKIASESINSGNFSSERIITQQQKQNSQIINNYYQTRKITERISQLSFGGSCANFSYKKFAENSVKLYSDEDYWNECLKNGHKIIKSKQSQNQISKNIKSALIEVEMAAYEGRTRATYLQEWKRYSRSAQFIKKIHK